MDTNIADLIGRVRKVSSVPCAIGFGISTPEQAYNMARISDGVIVGSAIVRLVAEYGKDITEQVKRFVKELRDAETMRIVPDNGRIQKTTICRQR